MFLEYGINELKRYIHISQVSSGRVPLSCPYCGQSLIARKGSQKKHHFAHDGETCRLSDKDFDALNVPLFDRFHTVVDGKAWKQLRIFRMGQDANMRVLADRELVYVNHVGSTSQYELTDLGKIPFGLTSLSKFADFQLSKIYERHTDLSETIRLAQFELPHSYHTNPYHADPHPEMVMPALVDLHIYRSQLARVFNLDLYLLEITYSEGLLYKIGVTSDIDRRITEIRQDLAPLSIKQVEVLQLLKGRGAVERYAQHRYHEYQKPIDTLTEYFEFDDKLRSQVLSDFAQLGDFKPSDSDSNRYHPVYDESQPKLLTRRGLISTIIDHDPPEIETTIQDSIIRETIPKVRLEEMQHADNHIERPSDDTAILNKYPLVVEYIKNGFSLSVTARKCRVSINTVRKVKTILTSY